MISTDIDIEIIITGGTIDSVFDARKDTVVLGKRSYVESYLKKLKLHTKLKFTKLFMKDSREIRYKDRQMILAAVKASKADKILITHGTYTMPDSAQYLKDSLANSSKTIVLTGSMIPLTGFEDSDASFNLGYAIASLQTLSPGVYICMNGRTFDPEKVDKNKLKARFEEVE